MKKNNRMRYMFLEKWKESLRWFVAYAATGDKHAADANVRNGIILKHISAINAPRVAGLSIGTGKDSREIKKWMESNDYALLHQTIPHKEIPGVGHEDGSPITAWQAGNYVVYWPWGDEFAETDIQTPELLGKVDIDVETDWIVGLGDSYSPIVFSINPKKGSPHYFAIGSTLSGKSTGIVNMVAQLAQCETTRFVIIDTSKKGDGLSVVPKMRSLIGPPAWTIDDAHAALAWLLREMATRYENPEHPRGRIVVCIDEFPGLRNDSFSVDAIEKLTSQAGQANITLVLIAQNAIQKALGPFSGIIKSNVSGRLVFKCNTMQSSIQALGDDRATKLVPPGDGYFLHDHLPQPLRIQGCYYPDEWLKENLILGKPVMLEWPDRKESETKLGGKQRIFTGTELGVSLLSAKLANGRPRLEEMLSDEKIEMGSTASRNLLRVGRDLLAYLHSRGLDIGGMKDNAPIPAQK